MPELISALFDNPRDAEGAVRRLLDIGVPRDAISVAARDDHGDRPPGEHAEGEHTGGNAGKGALAGLGVGAGLGALLGLAALAIPGIGPIVAGGALAQALGLAGAAGAAASGAIVGGTTGTLAGGLIGMGVHEQEAHHYEREIQRGATYVGVDVSRAPVSREVVTEALRRSNGRIGAAPAAQSGLAADGAAGAAATPAEMRVPLTEEVAHVQKVSHRAGEVAVSKRVETETRHISEPVIRARVETETREIAAGEPYEPGEQSVELKAGQTLRIAVVEEELVIQKVPRVVREVVIHARPEIEQVERDIELRRERVDVHDDAADPDAESSEEMAARRTA